MTGPLEWFVRDSTTFQFTAQHLPGFICPNLLLIRIGNQLDFAKLAASLIRAFSKLIRHSRASGNPGGRCVQNVLDSGFRRNDGSVCKAAIRDFEKALIPHAYPVCHREERSRSW